MPILNEVSLSVVFSPELELLFEELLLLLEALLLELLSVLYEAEEPCEGVLAELHATNDMDNKNINIDKVSFFIDYLLSNVV